MAARCRGERAAILELPAIGRPPYVAGASDTSSSAIGGEPPDVPDLAQCGAEKIMMMDARHAMMDARRALAVRASLSADSMLSLERD
jgi:hypothetical protein